MSEPDAPSKPELRERMRRLLASMKPEVRARQSAAIRDHLLNWDVCARARTIFSFLPTAEEPDLEPFHASVLASGKRLCLPRIDWDAGRMRPVAVVGPEFATEIRRHGIREPVHGHPVEARELDVILAPGLAFASTGDRLGRGAAFYDRFLAALTQAGDSAGGPPTIVGVCFSAQVLPHIPAEPHDSRMDAVVSDAGLIVCRT